jgi:tetrahydromethanopterin S-methyltransferase subunit B
MSSNSKKLTVTAVTDSKSGLVTAFFNELPGLLVQANTMEEGVDKLKQLLNSFIKRLDSSKDNILVSKTSVY